MATDLSTVTRAELTHQAEGGPSIGELMQFAMDKGGPDAVATLEKLVNLRIILEERSARKSYFDAIAQFQKICPPIPHDKKAKIVPKRGGAGFSYTYASLNRITDFIAPYLEQCGLSYTWDTEFDGRVFKVVCRTRHIDGHSESSSFPVPIDGNERMSAAQANGAALTYGKRQTIVAAFGLTTADTDVDGATGEMVSVDSITAEQAAGLSDLIEARWENKDARDRNRVKFLNFMGVQNIADIPANRYSEAVELLQPSGGA